MKKFVLACFLFAATPAFANIQPSFLEQIHNCVELSVAYGRFAQMAIDAQDQDRPAFFAYIQQIAESNSNPHVRDRIIRMGELAWAMRKRGGAQAGAMLLYEKCYNSLGTKI